MAGDRVRVAGLLSVRVDGLLPVRVAGLLSVRLAGLWWWSVIRAVFHSLCWVPVFLLCCHGDCSQSLDVCVGLFSHVL